MPTTAADDGIAVLRPLVADDGAAIQRRLNDYDIARWTGRIPYPYPPGAADAFLAAALASDGAGETLHRAMTLPPDPALVGVISLTMIGDGRAEVGYWLGRDGWGRGIARRALREMLALGRDAGLRQIAADVQSANSRSIGLLLDAGFRHDEDWHAPRDNPAGIRADGACYILDLN